jgi:hypothetical protein
LKELQRQSQINNMTNAGKLTQAGAYGGSRQAILQGAAAERQFPLFAVVVSNSKRKKINLQPLA